MFEELRRSLDELLQRATKPEDRRSVLARMKDTVVQATIGVDDLREALSWSQKKLAAEQGELATVRRRKELAAGINDAETLAVAERFEKQHSERAAVLEQKVAAQTRELELAERELAEMKAELRGAMAGAPASSAPSAEALEDPLENESAGKVKSELDAMARARARADREADAQRRLDEMKKNMGK
ncbi:MAG TPA: hypothetical protein VF483_10195 [Gemmatimonadaceae bacterium]